MKCWNRAENKSGKSPCPRGTDTPHLHTCCNTYPQPALHTSHRESPCTDEYTGVHPNAQICECIATTGGPARGSFTQQTYTYVGVCTPWLSVCTQTHLQPVTGVLKSKHIPVFAILGDLGPMDALCQAQHTPTHRHASKALPCLGLTAEG